MQQHLNERCDMIVSKVDGMTSSLNSYIKFLTVVLPIPSWLYKGFQCSLQVLRNTFSNKE